MSFLFDTDALSNPLKRDPSPAPLRRLALVPAEEQFTTSITMGELLYGAHKSQRAEHILRRLEENVWPRVQVLPFDTEAAAIYGRLRAELERQGTPLAEPDLRIASIALAHGMTLVTGNTRHFERVPGLQVENWMQ